MKYYIIAGEPSGDLHGAKIMQEIKNLDPNAEFRIWGGDKMLAQGGELVSHIRERAFMGIWEVVKNIRTIARFMKLCKKDLLAYKADALILVDYPGFNLKIAAFAKQHHIPVHFYIAPKVWAWNTKRVIKIKRDVDFLYSILPFEPDFFQKHGIVTDYVGNPLMDQIETFAPNQSTIENLENGKPIVALLPGSRKMELHNMMPIMQEMPKYFPEYRFIMAGSDAFSEEQLRVYCKNPEIEILRGQTYEILSKAKAALVTSGTATLETALWSVPQVVCYRFSPISYFIVKPLMKIKYISLVNLILDKLAVVELIQNKFTVENTQKELHRILKNNTDILNDYNKLIEMVGKSGASEKAAKLIVQRTMKKTN